ncbi:MAG: response regulator transcription factor [Verrucomicrobiota bacterium]
MRRFRESPIQSNDAVPPPVRRRHVAGLRALGPDEWSQWVPGPAGTGGWHVPLGTRDEARARRSGRELALAVKSDGWGKPGAGVVREFTWALFWMDAPLACTYTTLFTRMDDASPLPGDARRRMRLAVVEPDEEFRKAMVEALSRVPGCSVAGHARITGLATAQAGAMAEVVLVNRAHAEARVEALPSATRAEGNPLVFAFGLYPTSDHIFMSFSGLDAGYLLRRRPLGALLEPLDGAFVGGRLERSEARGAIRRYCQGLFSDSPGSAGARGDAGRVPLTLRERQVLSALQRGLHDKEIAAELGISPLTVHTHLKHVFDKLGARTRTEAVMKFLEK